MHLDVPEAKRLLRGRLVGLIVLACGLLFIPGVAPFGAPGEAPVRHLDAPALVADGAGGAFVAWRDASASVVVQRVDAAGAARWPAPGVGLGLSLTPPRLAADGSGGVLVGWRDPGGGLRVQRLGADGAPAWPAAAGSLTGGGSSFEIVGDGAGGAFVAWEDATGACCAIVVQRLDARGAATWSSGRRLTSAVIAGSLAAAPDGAGGVSIAFATTDGSIVLHRLDADGDARGGAVAVAPAVTAGPLAMTAEAGGGVVLAWAEQDGATVRAQRVDAGGRVAWAAGGVPVTDSAVAASAVSVAVDGLGRTTIAWQDARDGSAGCPADCVTRVQRLTADGAREWGDDGRALGTLPAFGPRVAAVGDRVVGAWQHCPASTCAGDSEVHVQTLGGGVPVTVGAAPLDSRASLIADGAGGVIVAWWQCAPACEVHTRRLSLDALKALAAPLATGPDLTVTALTVPTMQVAPGQTFSVANTIKNIGGTAAGAFRVGIYLSSTNTSFGGTPVGLRHVTPTLAAGMSSTVPIPVTIPGNTSAGPIFLVAVADDLGDVAEDNEANNTRSVPLTIVQPDLVVSAVTAPATGTIGGTLAVNTTVNNLTAGPVSATFTVGIFLTSSNTSVDPAVDRRVGSRIIPGLGAKATSSGSTTVNIPPDLVQGSYFVGAVADVDGVVPEGNVSNNSRVARTPTTFQVSLTSFTPTMGPVGTTVTLTGTSFPAVQAIGFAGGVNASSFTLLPPTSLRTTVPAGAVTGPITLVGIGRNVSSTTAFKVTPTIASFAPGAVVLGGNVSVTGTTLAGASVKIGSVAAPVVSSSDTQLVFTVPSAARTGPISVTNAGGTVTTATSLIVVRPPTITSFSPTSAPIGATVTINGSEMAAATDVSFNGTSAGPPAIMSGSSIQSVVPVGATTGPISVTNAAGTTPSVAIFHVAPRITGFSPALGLPGANVSITGTSLAGATAVKFGSAPALSFSSTLGQVVAIVPPTALSGRITVVTPDGQSVSPADFLVIRPPTVGSFSPAAGAVGATVTVNGTNLASATAVRFNGVPVDRRVVLSNNALRVTVPLGATTGLVSVTNAAGSANSSATFKVLPAISDVSPSSGFVGDTVTITGTSFTGLVSVKFGSVGASLSSPPTDEQVVVTVPTGAVTGPVTLTTGAGTATSATPFEVIRPPTVTSFTPGSGPTGTNVLITGESVGSATMVTFNGLNASSVTRKSASSVVAPVPLLATSGPIGITNPAGSVLSASPFRVTPSITGFNPPLGAVGTNVTISGSGFSDVPTVRFGGVAAAPPSSVSLTTLVAAVPAGALTGPITVTTSQGTGTTSARFTVVRTPTLTSFAPTSGAAGTSVLLVGTSLTSTSTVTFNGFNASVSSPNASVTTALRAVVPAGATTGPIAITNEAGTVTSSSNFHVLPTVTGFTPTAGAAGDTVTIMGNALNAVTGVRFGGADATVLPGGNASQVMAIVPGTATTGPITVITVEGSDTSADDFEVLGPMASAPRLRFIAPLR